jgi:hypothetical protein
MHRVSRQATETERRGESDVIRVACAKWLFDSALEIASQANRQNAAISVENENPHRFVFGKSNLSGSLSHFRQGVRCLTIEAGWTRTPSDGFMRGGALACARITHFGLNKHNAELVLTRDENLPNWFSVDKNESRTLFDFKNLQNHFEIFLGTV